MAVHRRREEQNLVAAVKRGDKSSIEKILQLGIDPNFLLPKNEPTLPNGSLLSLAIEYGHDHLVQPLLEANADPLYKGKRKLSPIHKAIKSGKYKIVEELLDRLNQNTQQAHYDTFLHTAAQSGHDAILRLLIDIGAHLDAKDGEERTPLALAALNSHEDVVRTLLAFGADIWIRGKDLKTHLHYAALGGNPNVVKLLVDKGLPADIQDFYKHSPLYLAQRENKVNAASWLLKQPCYANNDNQDDSVVMESWDRYDKSNLINWAEEGKVELLKGNLDIRDPHFRDEFGRTPLHAAAEWGQVEAVRVLLENDVYPAPLDYGGNTPADLILIRRNTTIGNKPFEDQTHLYEDLVLRQRYKEILDTLEKYEKQTIYKKSSKKYESLLYKIGKGEGWRTISRLLRDGAPMEPVEEIGEHAFHLAISRSQANTVSLMLAAGASLAYSHNGVTALELAWLPGDPTGGLKALVTRAYYNQLQFELGKLEQCAPDELCQGIEHIMETLKDSSHPGQARWPEKDASHSILTSYLSIATQHNCSLTAFFLHKAGGVTFQWCREGPSPIHVAVESGLYSLMHRMVKYMDGSLFTRNAAGQLAWDAVDPDKREQLKKDVYYDEWRKLNTYKEKMKDDDDKKLVCTTCNIQGRLYQEHDGMCDFSLVETKQALLIASQLGLQQLTYNIISILKLSPDTVVDDLTSTTALHQAAFHGDIALTALLLSLGANPLIPDRYGHTSLHFAAMNGPVPTYKYLEAMHPHEEACKAGTTPRQVTQNYEHYLGLYKKTGTGTNNHVICRDSGKALDYILQDMSLKELSEEISDIAVDFKHGEAKDVCDVISREFEEAALNLCKQDHRYDGTVRLVGSAADSTRLYAPDEFDISLVLTSCDAVSYDVIDLSDEAAQARNHKKEIKVQSSVQFFHGCHLLNRFHKLIVEYMTQHIFQDDRLSLVPPGIKKTQVGSDLALAWQGTEYPLLFISIDFVPVVQKSWNNCIKRPYLLPHGYDLVYLSNTSDKTWRLSFCEAEVAVLQTLDKEERHVFMTCKSLLSKMKTESWMPKKVRDRYTWWDYRAWKIPIANGFTLKNSFFRQLEKKRKENRSWEKARVKEWALDVFKEMCTPYQENVEEYKEDQVAAYFGGDFEKTKLGNAAPKIIRFLLQQ